MQKMLVTLFVLLLMSIRTDLSARTRHSPASDHTALQPEQPAPVAGTATPDSQVTVIKEDREIVMKVVDPAGAKYFAFTNKALPAITYGRVGLGQMFTRAAYYKNFRISTSD